MLTGVHHAGLYDGTDVISTPGYMHCGTTPPISSTPVNEAFPFTNIARIRAGYFSVLPVGYCRIVQQVRG